MTPDQPITLAVAVLGVMLSLLLPQRYALIPLVCSLFLYPSNLLLPPAQISMSAQRVIGIALLLRCLVTPSIRGLFKWGYIDTAAAIYFGLLVVSQVMTEDPFKALNNRVGFFLSALVPFWCVRFLLTDREALYALLKGILWGAIPIVLLGLNQMPKADNPFFGIMRYGNPPLLDPPNHPYQGPLQVGDQRLLFGHLYFRANVTFMQCIMLGAFFALMVAWSTNLFFEKRKVWPWIIPWLLLPAGIMCTISGGPMMAGALSFLILVLFPLRKYWKWAVGTLVIAYCAALALSHRGPLEILANFGFSASSSWYRVGLQNFTLHEGGMSGHWIAGYGVKPPIYEAQYSDLCIHWVLLLVINGILGLVGFYGFFIACMCRIGQASRHADSLEDQWLIWSLVASVVGSVALMMIVSYWMEMYFIYHIFLGVCANTPLLVGGGMRYVGVMAEVDGRQVMLRYALRRNQKLAIVHPPGSTAAAGKFAVPAGASAGSRRGAQPSAQF